MEDGTLLSMVVEDGTLKKMGFSIYVFIFVLGCGRLHSIESPNKFGFNYIKRKTKWIVLFHLEPVFA